MGPIFNEKVTEKWNLWVCKRCSHALFTVEKSTNAGLKKKGGGANVEKAKRRRDKLIQTHTIYNLIPRTQLTGLCSHRVTN